MIFRAAQNVTKASTLRSSEPQDILIWQLNHYCPVSRPSCVKRKRRVSFTTASFPSLHPASAALNKSQSCPSFTCSIQLVFCVNWTVSTGAFPEVTGGSFLVRGFKTWTVSADAQLKHAARTRGSICWDERDNEILFFVKTFLLIRSAVIRKIRISLLINAVYKNNYANVDHFHSLFHESMKQSDQSRWKLIKICLPGNNSKDWGIHFFSLRIVPSRFFSARRGRKDNYTPAFVVLCKCRILLMPFLWTDSPANSW